MVLYCGQGTNARFNLDMSSYLIALHICHVLIIIYIFFRCYFNSPVDHELGGDRQYIDYTAVPYSYPAQEGKRSPTSLIPVCKVFYLHTIQIYFAAPIVACGTSPTIPFHCSQHDYCRLVAHCQSCSCSICLAAIIYVGELSPEVFT